MSLREKVACEDCGKEVQRRGLSGHRRFVHGAVVNETKALVPEAVVATDVHRADEEEKAPASGVAVTYGPWTKSHIGETQQRMLHVKPAVPCFGCSQPVTHWIECSDCVAVRPVDEGHSCSASLNSLAGGVPLSTLTDISAVS